MDRDEWESLYDQADSLRALARQLGRSPGWVRKQLDANGIELRRTRTAPPTDAQLAAWASAYAEAGSVSELARRFGEDVNRVSYYLKKHGVEINSSGFASPKTVRHYGPDNASWQGGTYRHSDGYIYEYAPKHPAAASAKGYVLQHRLVMESKLGRYLRPDELVHHVNEVKDDNRPENLELHDHSTHMKHHKADAKRDAKGRWN